MANHPTLSIEEYGLFQAASNVEEEYQSHIVTVEWYIWWRMLQK